MKIAIMQPYFFPYIGYYQMANYVDTFVFLDDVNYIKKGWINRNTLPVAGAQMFFTIPLQKASQNNLICNTLISPSYIQWREKFKKTLQQQYGKSTGFSLYFNLLKQVLDTPHNTVSTLSAHSIISIAERLNMDTNFLFSSDLGCEGQGPQRIMNICKHLDATEYLNAPGGRHLYDKEWFKGYGVDLYFLQPPAMVPSYSIIHSLLSDPDLSVEQMHDFKIK